MKITLSNTQKQIIECIKTCKESNGIEPNVVTARNSLPFYITNAMFAAHLDILEELGVLKRTLKKTGFHRGKRIYILIDI